MSRRSKPARRIPAPDAVYNSVDIASFINRLMRRGKNILFNIRKFKNKI